MLRARHLNSTTIAPGASFSVGLNLFDVSSELVEALQEAFREAAPHGLGPDRARVSFLELAPLETVVIALDDSAPEARRVRIHLLTPTELKGAADWETKPVFTPLACRIRDRISTLRALYGDGPLAIDFREFERHSAQIALIQSRLKKKEASRRSTRSGQCHSLGGVIGEIEYSGDLARFLPYLEAAQWTGVGRYTVWGNGELTTQPFPTQP